MKRETCEGGKVAKRKVCELRRTFSLSRLFLLADLEVCEEKKSVKRKSPRTAKNSFYSKLKRKVCKEEKSAKRKSL